MDETYRKTVQNTATEAFKEILDNLTGFIDHNGLNMFGAGISGVGVDSRELAKRVLKFIYEENARVDYEYLERGANGDF